MRVCVGVCPCIGDRTYVCVSELKCTECACKSVRFDISEHERVRESGSWMKLSKLLKSIFVQK